ncbi:MAG: transglutaminase-like domain-containing protein [Planctomycetota bacterium]
MPLHTRWLTMLFLTVLWPVAVVAEPVEVEVEPFDIWYVIQLQGQKAGYSHVKLERIDDAWVTTSRTEMSIGRGAVAIDIVQDSVFVESLDYQPIRAEATMQMAATSTRQTVVFGPEQWKVTEKGVGGVRERMVDAPDEAWVTPVGLAVMMGRVIAEGGETIEATTLDLATGLSPMNIRMSKIGEGEVEVFGRVIPATQWSTSMAILPNVEVTQWIDATGNAVRQTIPMMPGMEMTMLLADEQLALAEFDAPELLAATLLTPDKPIRQPRNLERATFELVADDLKERMLGRTPAGAHQRSTWVDGRTLRIEIDLAGDPVPADVPGGVYRQATATLDSEDPVIMELVEQALDGKQEASVAERAEAIRIFVREFIDEKNLSVGFANASEVARTAEGDCSEHACLLAAMLRADGIPAQTVTGLVYADQFAGLENVFGFHMWAQAYIADGNGGGYWLDLDAAAPGNVNGFDATHIALSTSAMDGDAMTNEMVSILPIMQGVEIRVIQAR